jgi:hypothetical protein
MKGTDSTTPHAAKSAFHARGNLVAAMVVDSLGTGLFVPFVIIYFLHTTSIPLAVIGVSLSAAALAALPTPVAVGVLVPSSSTFRTTLFAALPRSTHNHESGPSMALRSYGRADWEMRRRDTKVAGFFTSHSSQQQDRAAPDHAVQQR